MADMQTPLRRVRGLGAARSGTEHFWHQRLTAATNIPLTIFFIGLVIALNGHSYADVRATLANPLVALLMAAMFISIFYHMKLGMQMIIEDYVHGEGTKIVLLGLNALFTIIMGVATLFALVKIAIGG